MLPSADNSGETDYVAKVTEVAEVLKGWSGPVVMVSHVDPDGDALGSTLALKRALEALGKIVTTPLEAPRFLRFLCGNEELSAPLTTLPNRCLLVVLDVASQDRVAGAPLEGAAFTVNVDHHGTNQRFGDLSLVEPRKAATAQMVKDLVAALGVPWTPAIATPCLAGILTDTGNLRFSNTTPDVLADAGFLIDQGVDYPNLTDRLQWRHPSYFRMLGEVMGTVEFRLDGMLALAHLTLEMKDHIGEVEDDSDDYVGIIRYAEGVKVAAFLKEQEGGTKVSVRSRDGVSAQKICLDLGGGGHVAAAGARVAAGLEETRGRVVAATRKELLRNGLQA